MKKKIVGIIKKQIVKSQPELSENKFLQIKKAKEKAIFIKLICFDITMIFLGIVSAGFGLKGFLIPSHFIDGGTMGLSLLVNQIFGINLALLIILINIPFILIGKNTISKEFAIMIIL